MSIKLKGKLKNKLVSILFLLLSIGITYYIFSSAQKTRQIMYVPVLNKELEYGFEITGDDIEMKEVGVYNMPGKIIRDKDDIVGKYAASDLYSGRYVYSDDLMDKRPAMTVKEKIEIGALAVETDLLKCVGGIPAPGDYVKINIIITDSETGELLVVQDPILERVKILALQNASGEYLKDIQAQKNSSFSTSTKEAEPSIIIFDATPEQERTLLKGLYEGRLHLTLPPISEDESKEEMNTEQIDDQSAEVSDSNVLQEQQEEIEEETVDVQESNLEEVTEEQ